MTNKELKWAYRMLNLAKQIANWSKDPNRQVGCIITTEDYHILSTGFNGLPKNFDVDILDEKIKNKLSIHAEINALLHLRNPVPNMKAFIVGGHPCSQCSVAMVQRGITTIYGPDICDSKSKWFFDMSLAQDTFKKTGVKYNILTI